MVKVRLNAAKVKVKSVFLDSPENYENAKPYFDITN